MTRFRIINLLIGLMFAGLILGLLNLEVGQRSKYQELSHKNRIKLLPQIGARGQILDRTGEVIVGNKLSYDLMVLPQESAQVGITLAGISRVAGRSPNYLKRNFDKGYVAASIPVTVAKNLDLRKVIALEELKLDFPSIIVQPRPVRFYPYGALACHLLGYVSEIDRWRLTKLADYGYQTKDLVGFGGVEEKYDYYLRQEEGGLSFEVDHRARPVRLLGFKPPRNGRDIQLTIDLKIQKIAEGKLGDRKGCVVIMDPDNGEIIALANFPNFQPALFVDTPNTVTSTILANPDAPLIDRASSGVYPPGSIFKVVVAAAALENRKINLSTTYFCPGYAMVGEKKFACWEKHGEQNLIAAITHSCNVFFYKTGILLGGQAIHDYAVKFGLSRMTSFELPYEASGFVPSPLWRRLNKFKRWYDGDTANFSIGQGDLLVTPLQITRLVAVFANKGYLVTPYVVKAIQGRDISGYQRKFSRISIEESTIEFIRQGLRGAVSASTGTANVLSSLSVSVAGKTGTAQAPPGATHGWFVGFFPYENPKFVICVLMERGGASYSACVLAKQIIEEMLNQGLI